MCNQASARVDTENFQRLQEEKGGKLRGSGLLIDLFLSWTPEAWVSVVYLFFADNFTRPFEMLVEGMRGIDTRNFLPMTATSS